MTIVLISKQRLLKVLINFNQQKKEEKMSEEVKMKKESIGFALFAVIFMMRKPF